MTNHSNLRDEARRTTDHGAPPGITEQASAFDTCWKARFEMLGTLAVPDSERAFYPVTTFSRRERFLAHLIRSLATHSDIRNRERATCLDIGCNTGRYTRMLADTGLTASGVDFAASMVHEARRSYPDLHFEQANVYGLPFGSGTFDAVTSFGLLPCLADWPQALKEMLRILRPGGVGVVETNRAYSTAENVLRCASYVLRGKMGFRRALAYFNTHAPSAARTIYEDNQPRYYALTTIASALRRMDAVNVTVHDPQRLPLYHDFESWGLVFVKGPASGTNGTRPHRCPDCRDSRRI